MEGAPVRSSSQPLSVLIVEDNPGDALLIRTELADRGYNLAFTRVEDGPAMEAALGRERFDIVICDYSLPRFGALEALRILQKSALDLPFLLVSGTIGEERAAAAVKAGAADYIMKHNLSRLAPAIERELRDAKARRDRRRTQQALERAQHLRALVLESAGEGIYGLDLDARTTFINGAAKRMLGWEGENLIGWAQHRISGHPESTAAGQSCPDCAAFVDGSVQRMQSVTFRRKDGSAFPVDYVSTPIREDGRVIGAVVTFSDVSERKRLEEQLLQAQKMEAVGRLAGGVAHDLNNLLTAMGGFSHVVRLQLGPEHPAGKHLEQIEEAARRAGLLTHQLLAFARRRPVTPRVFDANQRVLELDPMLRRLIDADIELITLPARNVGAIRMDPVQLEQVIMNLAVNARDAMPEGGKLIIETASIDEHDAHAAGLPKGSWVALRVRDNGCGMSEDVLAHLFEPFFTTKPVGKGTGLGLATCYGIVTQAGGQIRAESRAGEGSTFTVYLPRVAEAVAQPAPSAELAVARGSETILLVDDEPAVRSFAAYVLRDFGYTVLEARNGMEALRISASAGVIDLVVTDLVMPQMNGKELVNKLTEAKPDVRALYVTGYADPDRGHETDSSLLLLKPFSPEDLGRKVREILDDRASRSERNEARIRLRAVRGGAAIPT